MGRRVLSGVILVVTLGPAGSAGLAQAQPFVNPAAAREVPAALQPWIPWVLKGTEVQRCPGSTGSDDRASCAWSGPLRLELGPAGGRFVQTWELFAETDVPLPGDRERWPFDVRAGGRALAVQESSPAPQVRLPAGKHQVTGSFLWPRLPETLPVPASVGIVSLRLGFQEVPLPTRDEAGALFLGAATASTPSAPVEADRLEIDVNRLLSDEVPARLSTRVVLKVAGKAREVRLGPALPAGFLPQALSSPLPVRLESDGRLLVQIRPGVWEVSIEARHETPLSVVSRPAPAPAPGSWKDGPEVWAWQAQPAMRVVTVEGAPPVDPGQTTLPDVWRLLPAYLMNPGTTMRLVQRRRGDADPTPDELHLTRKLWLDFDGGGYTASDMISGRLSRGWRLDMGPQGALGRVAVGNADQLITRVSAQGPAGVEVREANLAAVADTRFPDRRWTVPAVGWLHDFRSVQTTLALGPGWRLVHASGADQVQTTWLKRWTLLDLFLVLVLVIATARLFGRGPAALALLTLVIIAQEPEAPAWIWLAVLVGEALVRALPAGQLRRAAKLYRLGAAIALVIVALPFCVRQARTALHPALEQGLSQHEDWGADRLVTMNMGLQQVPSAPASAPDPRFKARRAAKPDQLEALLEKADATPQQGHAAEETSEEDEASEATPGELVGAGEISGSVGGVAAGSLGVSNGGRLSGLGPRTPAPNVPAPAPYQQVQSLDPNARIQTGPGIPHWSWRNVQLSWNGPVQQDTQLRLYLSPPWLTGLLGLTGAALVAVLALLLLRNALSMFGRWLPLVAGLALLGFGLPVRPAHAQPAGNFPPKELLDQLRARLLENPPCAPACASFGRLALEASPDRLRLRLEVTAAATTVVDLPGLAQHWAPTLVVLDGGQVTALRRDGAGRLWLVVPPGAHQVVLEGALADRPVIQLPFGGLRPHAVTASLRGFTLAGVADNGAVGESLELTRVAGVRPGLPAAGTPDQAALAPQSLPPFVRVERTLDLGLTWQVRTRVLRLTPGGSAIVLQVPTLPNESVLTADTKLAGGKVQVNMGPEVNEVSWESTLAERSPITLQAPPVGPDGMPWIEVWHLVLGPVWHAEVTGIPAIHQSARAGVRTRRWRPWPGESVTIAVSRPPGVPGDTFTIDASQLQLRPGGRSTQGTLGLTLRSSRGGEHTLRLPAGASVESLQIDGREHPPVVDGNKVTLPLTPGSQQVTLALRTEDRLGWLFRTPAIDLGAPSVNADLQVNLAADRWVLLVGGPRLGPSVLMWSALVVLVLAGVFLGRSALTPLQTRQWILLGLGFAPLSIWAAVVVVGYLFALGWRRDHFRTSRPLLHDVVQVLLALWTLLAVAVLFMVVQQGLLSRPDMDIVGNGSSPSELRWSADRAAGPLPGAWVVSLPMFAYHVAMLAWALWLAAAVLRWSRWAWSCFTEGGLWRPWFRKTKPATQEPPGSPVG